MNDPSIARFWDKYILKTNSYGIKRHQAYWYVRHAEAYIKAAKGVRLSAHTPAMLEAYLTDKYDKCRIKGWQLEQHILALRILLSDMVNIGWADAFAWEDWFLRCLAFHHFNDPAGLDEKEVKCYLVYLVMQRKVSASTQDRL